MNKNLKQEFDKIDKIIQEIQKELSIMKTKLSDNNIDDVFHFYGILMIDIHLIKKYLNKIIKKALHK
jgi:hypothetical protein